MSDHIKASAAAPGWYRSQPTESAPSGNLIQVFEKATSRWGWGSAPSSWIPYCRPGIKGDPSGKQLDLYGYLPPDYMIKPVEDEDE